MESENQGLSRIQVSGFRSLAEVDIEPGRLTLLIGPNGAGKSNLLKLLQLIPYMRTGRLQSFVGHTGGAAAQLHYGPKVTKEISIDLTFDDDGKQNQYSVRLGHAAGDQLLFLDEKVTFRADPSGEERSFSLGAGHWESKLKDSAQDPTNHTARAVNWRIANMSFFHFHDTSVSSALRTLARAEDNRFLRSDGSNLPAYLWALQNSELESDRKAWRRINRYTHRVAPCIEELSPVPQGDAGNGNPMSIRLDWVDDRGEIFGVHHLSDGTLRAIALVTALAQPAERLPRFISIDEPELGQHPAAIALLADLARSISHRCQVILATQSPALLDHFQPVEVMVTERCQGKTLFRRLDPARLESWLEDYALSELFDKNVLGGRP